MLPTVIAFVLVMRSTPASAPPGPRFAAAATPAPMTSLECPATVVDTKRFLAAPAYAVEAPIGTLSLVAVRTFDARARGLMCVTRVPSGKGMIFVFPPPQSEQGFWMKDTLVALDMVFVTSRGVVSVVAANVPATRAGTPDERVARRSGLAQFVIELGAGDAARHGIVPGTKLQLPALTAQP